MREYDIIRRARAMLEAAENRSPSTRTIAGYEARARRIFRLVKAGATDGKNAAAGD